ncbi:YqjK-like family protein [Pseudothauera rhizosphaerae]|uniref:YqjK-like protein n=1 Tax=Pseudothauera rhizosphaerae TaxID=2565932 RepID=A0A4S4AJ49_9RHOO|nr:YqjK-like family protein [Pseudothauera rhizosphaerae]THF59418.1 hypothetical protein E6O51_15610 [Pseudothauera rhizosphaerae]
MNPRLVEFALRKQRLQIRAEGQREDMLHRLEGFESVLHVADGVRDNLRWAREHAPILSGAALLVVAWKPRLVLRLARRAWLGWVLYRRLARPAAPVAGVLGLLIDRLRPRR